MFLARILGGTTLAAVLAATAIAVWPASETDKARSDGEAFGESVAALHAAGTPSEVNAALADVHRTAADAVDHAGDAVADQIADQEDALSRAADGFTGMYEAGDEFEQDLYEAELDTAVDDLASNAEDFRSEGPEVQQAFWEGYDEGYASAS